MGPSGDLSAPRKKIHNAIVASTSKAHTRTSRPHVRSLAPFSYRAHIIQINDHARMGPSGRPEHVIRRSDDTLFTPIRTTCLFVKQHLRVQIPHNRATISPYARSIPFQVSQARISGLGRPQAHVGGYACGPSFCYLANSILEGGVQGQRPLGRFLFR